MPNTSNLQTAAAEEQDLRARLEKAEESLREILGGESDALFVAGAGGAQLFTLKGADQSYRTLIENMSEGALTLTRSGLILYANRRFAEMLGMPLEKVIGSDIHTWFAPESRQVLQTLLRKDAADGRREELALAAADGTQVPVNLSVSHLKLEGMPDSFCMVATDLTQQKRNETILAADSLARAILEQAADAIVICDETGRILRASKQAQALYGNNPLGQHFEHAFPLRQSDGTAFCLIGDIDTNPRQSVEARLELDGRGFDLLVSVGHLKGGRNELAGSVVTLTDITERKEAETQLHASELRFRQMAENIEDMFFLTDAESGQVLYVSPAYEEIWGRSRESLYADPKTRMEAIHQDDRTSTDKRFKQGMTSGAYEFEYRIVRPDGSTRWIETRGFPVRDDGGKIVRIAGVAKDITDRKLAEENRQLRAAELEESQRIARIGSWAWEIATGVVTWSDGMNHVLARDRALPPPNFESLQQFYTPESWQRLGAAIANTVETGASYDLELEMIRADGVTCWTTTRGEAVRGADGTVVKLRGTVHDITGQRRAEMSIKRLNRVYAMLSSINTLIVRVRDREELFRDACRIAVSEGEFAVARVLDVDLSGKIRLAATSESDSRPFQRLLDDYNSDPENTQIVLAIVMRSGQPLISNDVAMDPRFPNRTELTKNGNFALALLPVIVGKRVAGIIVLRAREAEMFDKGEMRLLLEMVSNLAFALDHIDKQARLDYLAYYDVLTGLANRTLFLDRMAQYMRSAASGGHKLAVFLIDLERFKNINDSLGRPAGDALLREVAEWLTREAGGANLVARVGPDQFVTVLPEVERGGGGAQLLEKSIKAFMDYPFHLSDAIFRVAVKVGAAVFPDDGADADTLFRHAEAALKKAKASGERYLFYTQQMTDAMTGKLTLENQLRHALGNDEFVLHYQPKVNLISGKVTSAEALIRWNDPRTGLVPPGRFIPVLEETGLIHEVGRWALKQAMADYLRWRSAGLAAVRIAVNVSPLQLRHRDFIAEIGQMIGIDPGASAGLELEITESLIMADVKHSISSLGAIRALGIAIAIDDFGTGFSSLSYLAKLPVDTLKIDRSFVIDMTAGPDGLALVSTIINLAHSLKLKVVAEGVETEEQSRLLRLLSCDEMQGFLFSKPVPVDVFEARFLASEVRA